MVSLLWFGILFISILLFCIFVFICLGFKFMVCNISSCILLYYCDNNVIFLYYYIGKKGYSCYYYCFYCRCIITDFEGRVPFPSGSRFHRIPSGYKLNNNNITGLRKLSSTDKSLKSPADGPVGKRQKCSLSWEYMSVKCSRRRRCTHVDSEPSSDGGS